MSEIDCDYSIRFGLPSSSELPASIGAKFVETLDVLSRIDPVILQIGKLWIFWQEFARAYEGALQHFGNRPRNMSRDQLGDPDPRVDTRRMRSPCKPPSRIE